eukprot:SM000011S19099  [mRNA]  locus=s11:957427:958201:+ [translate_table: standard]
MSLATTDLCDAHEGALASGELRALPPVFRAYGRRAAFCGPVRTLKVFEDNTLVRAALEGSGGGCVLVVDGGGSLRCALLGGSLAVLAEKNGWAGVVVHGCVRDTAEIDACELGVRALAPHPVKSLKRGEGAADVPVAVAGVPVRPGEWLYADADGVIVSASKL